MNPIDDLLLNEVEDDSIGYLDNDDLQLMRQIEQPFDEETYDY